MTDERTFPSEPFIEKHAISTELFDKNLCKFRHKKSSFPTLSPSECKYASSLMFDSRVLCPFSHQNKTK